MHYDTSYQPSQGYQHVSQDFLDSLSRETINRLQNEEDLQEDLRRRQAELTHELFRSPSSVYFEQGNEGGGNEGGGSEEMEDDQKHQHSDGEDAEDEGHRQGRTLKSTLFTKHFRKVRSSSKKKGQPEVFDIFCNYCDKKYKFNAGGGYGTFRRHITQKHPKEEGMTSNQSQLRTMFTSTDGGHVRVGIKKIMKMARDGSSVARRWSTRARASAQKPRAPRPRTLPLALPCSAPLAREARDRAPGPSTFGMRERACKFGRASAHDARARNWR